MEGELGSGEAAGIIPRSLNLIFDLLPKQCTEYSVRLSFLELYNEVRRRACAALHPLHACAGSWRAAGSATSGWLSGE
jgi:hypothetical protein